MTFQLAGRLVLDDEVVAGCVRIEGDRITEVAPDDRGANGPILAPGFIDLHVHGSGGHDAMGGPAALDGMARALLRRGVTSFLPTAVSRPMSELAAFADSVRAWMPMAPTDGSQPLGFNLEGPFLSPQRRGAHAAEHLLVPGEVPASELDPLLPGLRLITIAPELDGVLDLIGRLVGRGVVVSLGHSAATFEQARVGYDAGARSTTHLFNAMTGLHHRAPGLAGAALTDDRAAVELLADGEHVHPALFSTVLRAKPPGGVLLVSDAVAPAGTGAERGRIGDLEVEIRGMRCTLAGTDVLAGSVIGLDTAVRNLVRHGTPLPAAVAAASRNPARLLGLEELGRLAAGFRADLVELDDDLEVIGVIRAGERRAD
jgi:N-acetylglucosamine-6-phosphate deacetylase